MPTILCVLICLCWNPLSFVPRIEEVASLVVALVRADDVNVFGAFFGVSSGAGFLFIFVNEEASNIENIMIQTMR